MMSGAEVFAPPPDSEEVRKPRRGVALNLVISLLGVGASIGVTWGAWGNRIDTVERETEATQRRLEQLVSENKQLRDLVGEVNTKLAVVTSQNMDLKDRLARIESKLDRERDQ